MYISDLKEKIVLLDNLNWAVNISSEFCNHNTTGAEASVFNLKKIKNFYYESSLKLMCSKSRQQLLKTYYYESNAINKYCDSISNANPKLFLKDDLPHLHLTSIDSSNFKAINDDSLIKYVLISNLKFGIYKLAELSGSYCCNLGGCPGKCPELFDNYVCASFTQDGVSYIITIKHHRFSKSPRPFTLRFKTLRQINKLDTFFLKIDIPLHKVGEAFESNPIKLDKGKYIYSCALRYNNDDYDIDDIDFELDIR